MERMRPVEHLGLFVLEAGLGSMDTTVEDYAKFLAGFMRGEGLSASARAEMLRPQIAISSAHQFPTLLTQTDARNEAIALSAGLGVVLFVSPPAGPGYVTGQAHSQRVAIKPAPDGARDLIGRIFRRVVSRTTERDDLERLERASRPLDNLRITEPGVPERQ
jgi:hypothetical protein